VRPELLRRIRGLNDAAMETFTISGLYYASDRASARAGRHRDQSSRGR
jgi:hypothetical protein